MTPRSLAQYRATGARSIVSRYPRFLRWLSAMAATRRQRARLRDLDAHILRDIGLSTGEAEDEARRRIWDVPDSWRR